MERIKFKEQVLSLIFSILVFIVLGSVAALWKNSFFVRMTPVVGFEIPMLVLESVLIGLQLAIKSPSCTVKRTGVGGVLGFLGIACPVCNKLLVFLIGAPLLFQYFEPARPYVGMIGILILAWALRRKLVESTHPSSHDLQAARENASK